MKKPIILALITVCISQAVSQPSVKTLKSRIEEARIDWGVPGLSVAIVYRDKVYLNEGFGVREQGQSTPVDNHTQYAIASNTKAFVSAALGTLVQDGRLSWDDPVQKYLPEFAMYDPYVSAHITVRDLLCHRAGLGTFSGDVIWYKSERPAHEVIEKIRYLPQAYEFRSGYGYSNLMFITAGEVIHAITGQSWSDFLEDRFFAPLDMKETITTIQALSDNAATPHKPVDGINQPIPWTGWDNMGAAGGIISTVDDMSRWVSLLLHKGVWKGDTLIDPDVLNTLWTPHNTFTITEKDKEDIPGRHFNGYGLGWGLFDYYGRGIMTHSGGYDGMYSRVVLVPDEGLGIVILTNSMTGIITPIMFDLINQFIKEDTRDWYAWYRDKPKSESMQDWIEQRKKARLKGTRPRLPLKQYTGSYYDPLYGEITVQDQDGILRLSFEGAPGLNASLVHWHLDTWEIQWDEVHAWFDFGLLTFDLNNTQDVTGISFDVPNHDIFFEEIHAKKK